MRREVTHNQCFPRLSVPEETLDAYFAKLSGSNEKLARLYTFQFDKKKPGHKQKAVLMVGCLLFHGHMLQEKAKGMQVFNGFGTVQSFFTANLQ